MLSHYLLSSRAVAQRRSGLDIARALRNPDDGLRTDGRSTALRQNWLCSYFSCDRCVAHCTAVCVAAGADTGVLGARCFRARTDPLLDSTPLPARIQQKATLPARPLRSLRHDFLERCLRRDCHDRLCFSRIASNDGDVCLCRTVVDLQSRNEYESAHHGAGDLSPHFCVAAFHMQPFL